MQSIKDLLQGLTLEDLREWAGSKIYNRGKEYVPCVSQLSRTEDGTLAAWVSGSDEYATTVRYEGQGEFDYDCSCPYDDWGPCKHAVAVLLAAAGQLRKNEDLPLLDPDDDLYLDAFEEDEDDWLEDDDEPTTCNALPKGLSPQIEAMLAQKSADELRKLLVDLALDFPEVARRLSDTERLEGGQIDHLVRSLRKEIRRLTAEAAWYDHWRDEGNLPDYSHVEEQLEALRVAGHADAVVGLAEELWERGVRQVEESHDEGEIAMAIAACLDVVLRALPETSWTPAEQLLWRIEHELDDEYGLLDGADNVLNDPHYTQEHWRAVAEVLRVRLDKLEIPKSASFSATYRRERVMNWLRKAYLCSGDEDKIIPLLEQEADRCRSYNLLVETLIEAGESERARQWCIRGYEQTIAAAPGIAAGLQARLRDLAEREGRFELAAAYRAADFFQHLSLSAYRELQAVAEKIDAWPAVRAAILAYLKTGKRATGRWPLPEPEVQAPQPPHKISMKSFPNRELLIEIAIQEKRSDDAVAIYRELVETKRRHYGVDEQLAAAVTQSHPDVSLQIWQSIAERLIGHVKPKAYQEAAIYLRKMHKLYAKTGRGDEWKGLIIRLRTQHKAKRRLMEVLDGLENDRQLIG